MNYRPHELAELLGVSVKTLHRWDANGKLKALRTPGNQRYYNESHLNKIRGIKPEARKIVVYTRVSSYAQKPELEAQKAAMSQFCTARGVIVDEIIAEIGGGLNFKRKKFLKLLTEVQRGLVSQIYVAHKDRLCRFAFELVEWICETNDTTLIVVNDATLSPQQEIVEDLMAIVHCFSCRLYGKGNYEKDLQKDLDKNLDTKLKSKSTEIQC